MKLQFESIAKSSRGSLKLIMVLLVRNESDILDDMLRFHLSQGVDYIVAIDNGSIDGTLEILESYQKKGVLALATTEADNYNQASWMTEGINYAFNELGASWVIPSDADEFWYASNGNLRKTIVGLEKLGKCTEWSVERGNLIGALSDEGGDVFNPIHFKYRVSEPCPFPKGVNKHWGLVQPWIMHSLPGKVIVKKDSFNEILMGNHSTESGVAISVPPEVIKICHFPIRSWEQFEYKVKFGGRALTENKKIPLTNGWHWRRWYDLFLKGELKPEFERQFLKNNDIKNLLNEGVIKEDLSVAKFFEKKKSLLRIKVIVSIVFLLLGAILIYRL